MPTLTLSHPLGSDDAQDIGLEPREFAVGEVITVSDYVFTTLIRTGYGTPYGTAEDILLIGEGSPTGATGVDGQWYLDSLNEVLWGPKTGGSWPSNPIRPDRGVQQLQIVGNDLRVTYSTGTTATLGRIRMVPRGPWATGVAYAVDDLVYSDSATFRVKTAHTSSGSAPSRTTPGANYELLVASPDATAALKGGVRLAGELTGTADAPVIAGRLGKAALTITDWNNVVDAGFYMASGAANAPTTGAVWYLGIVEAHNTLWVTQTLHAFTADTATTAMEVWRRSSSDVSGVRTWSAWKRLLWTKEEQEQAIGTATGRSVLNAADAAAARTAISAVSSSDSRLTDARTPTSHTHPSSQISDATAAATANMVAKRDAAGRLAVAAGSATGDAANVGQLTSFGRDRGAGTALPTTDLRRGDAYYLTSAGCLFVYTGAAWQQMEPGTVADATAQAAIPAAALYNGFQVRRTDTGRLMEWDGARWFAPGAWTNIDSDAAYNWVLGTSWGAMPNAANGVVMGASPVVPAGRTLDVEVYFPRVIIPDTAGVQFALKIGGVQRDALDYSAAGASVYVPGRLSGSADGAGAAMTILVEGKYAVVQGYANTASGLQPVRIRYRIT